jgi:phosphoribosylamine--glycine ligase
MRVLLVGGGGREHALAWKMSQSPQRPQVFAAPGNAGIAELAQCLPIAATDIDALITFARERRIDLTVVGPETPLENGLVNRFQEHGLTIFGPTRGAARLETSKVFAKEFMTRHRIPTASAHVFDSPVEAQRAVRKIEPPLVVKADGLAAGKGAIVAWTTEEALSAVHRMMVQRAFGEAGRRIIIEEYLRGEEASILALVDGERYLTMIPSQDHKPIFDGDRGPNTGGMGAYAPAPVVTGAIMQQVEERILSPAISGMAQEGYPFRGVLYAGLMVTPAGPRVVEFNCRFGDPETQAIVPIMKDDLLALMLAAARGDLGSRGSLRFEGAAVCVVMASAGYPGAYCKGYEIRGLQELDPEVFVFHAGTRREDSRVLTDGGRVLGVTGTGPDVGQASRMAYRAVEKISFQGAQYRQDIARRALHRKTGS